MSTAPRLPLPPGVAEPVLAVLDRAMLLAIPLLVGTVLIGRPAFGHVWAIVGVAGFAMTIVLGRLGRAGRACWRGSAYTGLMLAAAIASLWTLGPFTGTGVMFGIAILFAGAFLRSCWLFATCGLGAGAILLWAACGRGAHPPSRFEVPAALWFGTALASAILIWTAARFLRSLVDSLEHSHQLAATAYERETTAREALGESRTALDELAQVELLGRLAGGVAHDMNNALSPIVFASDILASELETAEQRRHLAELDAATHHVADLVRDLLWIGRKFPTPSASAAELGATIRACLERIHRTAAQLAIAVDIDPTLRVAVAPEHLEQVVFGLVLCGCRTGITRMRLTSELDTDTAVLVLQGIERGADGTRPRDLQILLGVSAAKDLLLQAGGSLEWSEADGFLQVRIRLPLAAERRSLAVVPRARQALVVEDEPMVLRRLCQVVARLGYEVRAASTVAEGLAQLDNAPDLVVTDLQLPDGSGEDIAIASYQRRPSRPIVVCSGFRSNELSSELLRLAPLTFLAKPFATTELQDAIALSSRRCA